MGETVIPGQRLADTREDRDRAPPLGADRSEQGRGNIVDTQSGESDAGNQTPGAPPGQHQPVADRLDMASVSDAKEGVSGDTAETAGHI